ncbi:Sulfhydryl oxidase 2 [Dissostichus eleginoides]|uniref:Sulfhydryl oxidase 2 n=1 Tax=Dissostichus eleginoides TaxID=100907 RepID=A0AAD9C0K6_DISEL|nr:Sulfhydryl oxidase 2 [Dissostichus eleginoides]
MLRLWFFSAGLWLLAPRCGSSSARLYTEEDPLVILSGGSFSPSVTNSSSAWFIQFYSSWCGHCIQYSETWKNLARDVQEFNIKFYPTFKYFRAHSPETERGTPYRDREIQSVRQVMVNILQNHTQQDWPDRCPPLRPYSSVELLPRWVRGQIITRLSSWRNRTLMCSGEESSVLRSPLLDALKIQPSPPFTCCPNASHTHLQVQKRLRFFFSSVLRRYRSAAQGEQYCRRPGGGAAERESIEVELATHSSLQGEELQVFKDLVTLVSKAVLDLVDNTMRISGVFLGAELRWVGCQGSRAGLRGLQGEAAVLHVMRRYITTFFGCEACGRHFEQAAAESLQTVKSCEQQEGNRGEGVEEGNRGERSGGGEEERERRRGEGREEWRRGTRREE